MRNFAMIAFLASTVSATLALACAGGNVISLKDGEVEMVKIEKGWNSSTNERNVTITGNEVSGSSSGSSKDKYVLAMATAGNDLLCHLSGDKFADDKRKPVCTGTITLSDAFVGYKEYFFIATKQSNLITDDDGSFKFANKDEAKIFQFSHDLSTAKRGGCGDEFQPNKPE